VCSSDLAVAADLFHANPGFEPPGTLFFLFSRLAGDYDSLEQIDSDFETLSQLLGPGDLRFVSSSTSRHVHISDRWGREPYWWWNNSSDTGASLLLIGNDSLYHKTDVGSVTSELFPPSQSRSREIQRDSVS
jgi:hypothetical protein